jgi:hypothetical protein
MILEVNPMKGTNRLLIAIVIGAILLILATFVIVLNKPEATYQSENTPGGVAHNYLLALQNKDFERAYDCISTTLPGYPKTIDQFIDSIEDYSWYFRLDTDTTLVIDTVEIIGTRANVMVRETRFYNRGLFESSTSISTFKMDLELEKEQWRIVDSGRYFAWCWRNETGCRE